MAKNADTPNGQPTETSPLLPRTDLQENGAVTDEARRSYSEDAASPNDNIATAVDAGGSHGDQDTATSFEGLPEVKKRLKYILPALSIGIFLAAADQTITVSSYAKIGTELNALSSTSWIATAYFLTLTTFQPLYGKLSDIWGRKACLLFAYATFGLGCLFCGLAKNIQQLIAARAFAGIGGGGMTTVVSIMFSDIVTLRERGKWQGYLNIIFAAGAGAGAPLGGIIADYIGWRWAFLGQAPLCLIAFIAVYSILHLPKRDEAEWKVKLARIDFLGAGILIAAVFTLLVALDRGSNVGWRDTVTLINVGLTIPLFVAFTVVELRVAKEPFAPGYIISNRNMLPLYICNFFSMAGYMSAMFYVPLYWQAVDNVSATVAGSRLIPSIICSVCGSLLGGLYMQRTGNFYWITVSAYTIMAIGMVVVILASGVVLANTPLIIIGLSITSFTNGIGITTTLIGLIAHASNEDQAVATACSYLFRSLGTTFGISMSATVANLVVRWSLDSELSKLGLPPGEVSQIANGVRESLEYLRHLKASLRTVVAHCYAHGTTAAFTLELLLLIGCAISSWFIREKSLGK